MPRVVIEAPVLAHGKGNTRELLRHLRAEHYWTVRRCYDAQLREHPELGGRVVLRLTQNARGVVTRASSQGGKGVPDQRKHKTALKNSAVGSCLAAFRGASLPLARKGGATFSFSVDLYPGDAPLPERDTRPSRGEVDRAKIQQIIEDDAPALGSCFVEASRRHPGLWGRLALRFRLDPGGRPQEITEVETTFPDADAVRCVRERLALLPGPGGRAVAGAPAALGPAGPVTSRQSARRPPSDSSSFARVQPCAFAQAFFSPFPRWLRCSYPLLVALSTTRPSWSMVPPQAVDRRGAPAWAGLVAPRAGRRASPEVPDRGAMRAWEAQLPAAGAPQARPAPQARRGSAARGPVGRAGLAPGVRRARGERGPVAARSAAAPGIATTTTRAQRTAAAAASA